MAFFKVASLTIACRVSFEARGELDLKAACTSHMALVVDKPEHEYNPGGQMQPEAEDLLKAVPGRHHCTLSKDVRGHCQARSKPHPHKVPVGAVNLQEVTMTLTEDHAR